MTIEEIVLHARVSREQNNQIALWWGCLHRDERYMEYLSRITKNQQWCIVFSLRRSFNPCIIYLLRRNAYAPGWDWSLAPAPWQSSNAYQTTRQQLRLLFLNFLLSEVAYWAFLCSPKRSHVAIRIATATLDPWEIKTPKVVRFEHLSTPHGGDNCIAHVVFPSEIRVSLQPNAGCIIVSHHICSTMMTLHHSLCI